MNRRPEQLARYTRIPTWLLLTVAAVGALGAIAIGGDRAHAAGSDAPIPYTVDVDGITLAPGDLFSDGDHVNIRYTADGVDIQDGIHLEAKCVDRADAECAGRAHDVAQIIGTNHLPLTLLTYADVPLCITWVQISLYAPHFGEGGQAPVCTGTPTPTPTPTSTPTPESTPSATPTPTATPEPSPTTTATPTPTTRPSSTPDASPEPSPLQTTDAPVAPVLLTGMPDELAATGVNSPHRGAWIIGLTIASAFAVLAGILGIISDTRTRRRTRTRRQDNTDVEA